VRILVYGDSITGGSCPDPNTGAACTTFTTWPGLLNNWLKTTYPNNPNLVFKTVTHGSCAASCFLGIIPWLDGLLFNRLPDDVFAWHPDLIIFRALNANENGGIYYDHVIKGFYQGCSAFDDLTGLDANAQCTPGQKALYANYHAPEVLVMNDHQRSITYPTVDPAYQAVADYNQILIPSIAAKYQYTFGDIYHEWAAYLTSTGTDVNALLADGLHLNPAGNIVMASLVQRDLCYKPGP
jgi:lysophospholipase L1-like esterase